MKKIKIESKVVKLSDIRVNPDNPRTITEKALELLTKSLEDFPEMLNIREIVVDDMRGCKTFWVCPDTISSV